MVLGLQINKETAGNTLTVHIKGDLNVKTSPYLEELTKSLAGVEYISSAGLRVLLAMKKNASSKRQNETLAC